MAETIDSKVVGYRVREIRKQLGLSMTAFAEKIDNKAKSGTISNWETGKNLPNNERLKKIAELGNISVDKLLYGVNTFLDNKNTVFTVMAASFKTIKNNDKKAYVFNLAVDCASGNKNIVGVVNCLFEVTPIQVAINKMSEASTNPFSVFDSSFAYSFITGKDIEFLQSDSAIFKRLDIDQTSFIFLCDQLDKIKVNELVNILLNYQVFKILYSKGIMLSGKGVFSYNIEANWLNKYFFKYNLTTKETIEFKNYIETSDNEYI